MHLIASTLTRIVAVATMIATMTTIGLGAESHDDPAYALVCEGIARMKTGSPDDARPAFEAVIAAYPESRFVGVAWLALGDVEYLHASPYAARSASGFYSAWLRANPDHPLAWQVAIRAAEATLRSPDRDGSNALFAYRLLKDLPLDDLDEQSRATVRRYLLDIAETLATHELKVARFYFHQRGAFKASLSRSKVILDRYPEFSGLDEALFLYGASSECLGDEDGARASFTRLCRSYRGSLYYARAAASLGRLGAPVPESEPVQAPAECGLVIRGRYPVSAEGVLFDRSDRVDVAIEKALRFVERRSVPAPGTENRT